MQPHTGEFSEGWCVLRKISSSGSDDTEERRMASHLRASEDPKEDLVIGFIREIISQFKYSAIKYSVKWLKFKSTF